MFFKSEQAQNIDQMVEQATSSPQKKGISYFAEYFDKGGAIDHPQLGNLLELAEKIDTQYDIDSRGANLVSGYIRFRLNTLSDRSLPPLMRF